MHCVSDQRVASTNAPARHTTGSLPAAARKAFTSSNIACCTASAPELSTSACVSIVVSAAARLHLAGQGCWLQGSRLRSERD